MRKSLFFILFVLFFIFGGCSINGNEKTPTPDQPVEPTPDVPVEPTPEDPTQPVEPTPEDPTQPVEPTPDDPTEPDEHVHIYNENVVPSTCIEGGYTEYTCSCGDSYIGKYTDKQEHNLKNGICLNCAEYISSVDLKFKINNDNNSYTVIGCGTCTDNDIVIPETYKGLPVTSIGSGAFSDIYRLKSVVISKNVTSIGDYAFSDCDNLTSVYISNGVTHIGEDAFEYCRSLKNINIPNSVISIGEDAFLLCDRIEYNEYDNAKYLGNEKNPYLALIEVIDRNIISCEIHEDTKIIYSYAFCRCVRLKTITIPDGATSIGLNSFVDCWDLTTIIIPDSIIFIESGAFGGCKSLTYNVYKNAKYLGNKKNPYFALIESIDNNITSCEIHEDMEYLTNSAFLYCRSLKNILVDENNQKFKSIEGNLYSKDGTEFIQYAVGKEESLFEIPEGVTSLSNHAFASCINIWALIIPNSVTSIKQGAFNGCLRLTIYCVASEQPDGWDARWAAGAQKIVWEFKKENM